MAVSKCRNLRYVLTTSVIDLCDWHAPIEWSGVIVIGSWASGLIYTLKEALFKIKLEYQTELAPDIWTDCVKLQLLKF